jgi:SAM-dependent methyltransferase
MPTLGITAVKDTWESFAQQDALGAILTDPSKKRGRWEISEFMETGLSEISTVLNHVRDLGLSPDFNGLAVDFGCGVGRLSRALAKQFNRVVGVDIAATMISTAVKLNSDLNNCKFVLNTRADLEILETGSVSFIYSNIVLQHMPGRFAQSYLREFVRILEPGGIMVFQIADSPTGNLLARMRYHIRPRTRVRQILGKKPMMMYALRENLVRQSIFPSQVVDVRCTNATVGEFAGDLKYIESSAALGLLSKQYCCVKPKQ